MGAVLVCLVLYLLMCIAFTWFCGHCSHQRGHGWMLGLVLGFFLGPIGLVIILMMKSRARPGRRSRRAGRGAGGPQSARGARGTGRIAARPTTRRMRTTQRYVAR